MLPASLENVRRKLRGSDDGDRQMVAILAAALSDGLPVVEAACAEALCQGVYSSCVILNILARRKDRKRCSEALRISVAARGRISYDRPMKRTVHHSDDRIDGPKPVSPRRIEVYTGSQGRRRWPDERRPALWLRAWRLTCGHAARAAAWCRAQQIHDWRRLARMGKLALPAAAGETIPAFVPLLPDNSAPAGMAGESAEACIAVEIADATVRVSGRPGAEALFDVFSALRRSRRC